MDLPGTGVKACRTPTSFHQTGPETAPLIISLPSCENCQFDKPRYNPSKYRAPSHPPILLAVELPPLYESYELFSFLYGERGGGLFSRSGRDRKGLGQTLGGGERCGVVTLRGAGREKRERRSSGVNVC